MLQLYLDTGDCNTSPMDLHCPDGSPQVDSCLGYFGTPPLVEGKDDLTSNSNGCGHHHTFGPQDCNADFQVRASVISRRSHEGNLWRRHAMPVLDREIDLDGQTLGTEAVATGDDSFDYPNTEPSNASPGLIYTKRKKSGVGDQNPLPGGNDSTDPSKQNPGQGNGNNGGGNGNGDNQSNGGGPGNGNGNNNGNGNGNGNGAGNTGPGTGSPPSGGPATSGGGAASSTGSGGGLPTATSNDVGPTSGASAPSTSSPSIPTETSNGGGSSTSVNQSNSDGNPASTTNQNDRPTTTIGAAPTTQVTAIASQFPQGSTDGGGSSGVVEVWSTISTVSTFTSTGIAVVTLTSGSSVLTTTKPTTSIGVTTLSIPTTVSVPANDTQHHSNSKVGSIVGAVIGTILGCILLLVMLLWFRRRHRRRNSVGFFYLTPGPGQGDSIRPRMSQATGLQADRVRASTSPSALSLPSLIDLNRSRTPTTDGLAGSPYELLPRASSNSYLGLPENSSPIDYPHPENPFADPPLSENASYTASSNPFDV